MTKQDNIEKLEEEYKVAETLRKRMEVLRKKQPTHLRNYRQILEAYDELEQQFDSHLQQEEAFLKHLPKRLKARIEHDAKVLTLRKQILELVEGK